MNGTRTASSQGTPTVRARRRIPARTRLDFALDATLLVAFVLAYSLGFTGIAIHEWLGLGLGLALLIHLTLHFDWAVRTTGRLLRRGGRERLVWLLNLALMIIMTLCIASGILISAVALPALGFTVAGSGFWRGLHGTTATLTLILVAVHVAVRWKWILSVGRRLVTRPARPARPARRDRLARPQGRDR